LRPDRGVLGLESLPRTLVILLLRRWLWGNCSSVSLVLGVKERWEAISILDIVSLDRVPLPGFSIVVLQWLMLGLKRCWMSGIRLLRYYVW